MFEQAIISAQNYTRPLLTVYRKYNNALVPGAATLFFVNDEGVAITCKHVAQGLINADAISQKFRSFKQEKAQLKHTHLLAQLELKYDYKPETVVEVMNTFQNCFDSIQNFQIVMHSTLDLAIIKFSGFQKILYTDFAYFIAPGLPVNTGKYLCRLGYPFPEFNHFGINTHTDSLEWKSSGNQQTPVFPIDGMITRFAANSSGELAEIELSTPGLRGQSGGPLFDSQGTVYGMQSSTVHLHLGFDIKNKEVVGDSGPEMVSNHPFLHVGRCIHGHQITKFLAEQGVKYYTRAIMA